jgi:hypothetical protein
MRLTPRTLFVIDAAGAVLSATVLAGVVAQWEGVFGLPARVPYALATAAACFAAYSTACRLWVRERWPPWLLGIGMANAGYGLVTLGLIARMWPQLTRAGVLYFVLELAVLAPLVWVEVRTAVAGWERRV